MNTLPHFTLLGAGPVLLMLHGIGGGHLAFAPQVETFAGMGYRAVAWDMPGYGSSPPIEPYTFKGLAERCIALIEALTRTEGDAALGPHPVILLGHSMGGMVAQEVVLRRPELPGDARCADNAARVAHRGFVDGMVAEEAIWSSVVT